MHPKTTYPLIIVRFETNPFDGTVACFASFLVSDQIICYCCSSDNWKSPQIHLNQNRFQQIRTLNSCIYCASRSDLSFHILKCLSISVPFSPSTFCTSFISIWWVFSLVLFSHCQTLYIVWQADWYSKQTRSEIELAACDVWTPPTRLWDPRDIVLSLVLYHWWCDLSST